MQTITQRAFDYDAPVSHMPTAACQIRQAWAKVADTPDKHTAKQLKSNLYCPTAMPFWWRIIMLILGFKIWLGRVAVASAIRWKWLVSVQLMPRKPWWSPEYGLWGESAKILSPEKTVLMPDLEAECSLDLGCPAADFSAFCDQHPDRTVVVYANTSAAVKARADWVVTSSVALEIVSHLKAQGQKLIWGPDRHLGSYIQRETGADMLLWQGSCIVHNEFQGQELAALKRQYPEALVLVHPESPQAVVELGDVVGSTSKLLHAVTTRPEQRFIVATDLGILHQMQKQAPDKILMAAPTAGNGGTCKSCAFCPWMAMNSLIGIRRVLHEGGNEIQLDRRLGQAARRPLQRMLDFAADLKRPPRERQMGPA